MSTDNFSEKRPSLPSHIAYSVEPGKDDKSHWHKVGAAWPTKNEGLKIQLSAIPLDGVILLRAREEIERMKNERNGKAVEQQRVQPTIKP